MGCLGGSVGKASDFGSDHDLMVRGFKPRVGLCADKSELRQFLCHPLSLSLPYSHSVCFYPSKINKP